MSITKILFRTALIGGLGVGVLTLVAGPDRVHAGFTQAQQTFLVWFDSNLDDPVKVRQQLKKLQREYPAKIKEVRRHIMRIDAELTALARDSDVAGRVVNMAGTDLETLAVYVEKANVYVRVADGGRPVLIKFQGRHLTLDQAYDTALRIRQTVVNYQDRLAANERDTAILLTQRDRMAEQLAQMETKYASFQAQVWQIERQVAAIERNKALIELLEERRDVIEANDVFRVNSLEQLSTQLAQIQAEHEAIIASLTTPGRGYELEVRGQSALNSVENVFDWQPSTTFEASERHFPIRPLIIDDTTPMLDTGNKVASRLDPTGDSH